MEASTVQELSTEEDNRGYEEKPDDLRQGIEEEIGIIDEALLDKTLDKEDRMNLIKDRTRLKRELSAIAGEKNENKPCDE